MEGLTITTKEFKKFQNTFLIGYSVMTLGELIASASFYHCLISLGLNLQQITKLYIVSIISSTLAGVLIEIVDIGTRKDKCCASAILFSISMFSFFFGGHYEMLMIGRVVYGAGSAFLHSAFDAYLIHEHTTLGFPDDWLSQTFSMLTHSMSLVAAVSGTVGQTFGSVGALGCPGVCCCMFLAAAGYIFVVWPKDMNGPRFMLSGFVFNMTHLMKAAKVSKHLVLVMLISTLCESSITIFSYYWAPWITSVLVEEAKTVPYEIVFSTYISASMLGNYMYQLIVPSWGNDMVFQMILVGSSGAFFLGSVFQTPVMVFIISIFVQGCVGGYWPSIGFLRGRYVVPELRGTCITLSRLGTLIISVLILTVIHHNPMMMLVTCAILNGTASYLQNRYVLCFFRSIHYTCLVQTDFKSIPFAV